MATNFQINISTDILTPLETTKITNAFQAGDKNGHSIRVKLYTGKERLTAISGSVIGYFQTEYNATPFSSNGTITSDNVVVVDIPASAYAEEGSVVAIVRLSDGSNTTTIAKLAFNVVDDVEQSGTTPTGTSWTVAQIDSYLDRLEEYVDTFQSKLDSVDATIGEIKGTVGQMFDLTDTTFTTVDATGAVRTTCKYVADNGKIKATCTLRNGRSFISFSNRPNLSEGTYTLSARVQFDSTLTGRAILVGIGVGSGTELYGTEDNEFYVDYVPKTERGGNTDVTTETVGYIRVTQKLVKSSAFGFSIVGKNYDTNTTDKPLIIDQIQLEYGPTMSAYSTSIGSPTAVDVFARRDIVDLGSNFAELSELYSDTKLNFDRLVSNTELTEYGNVINSSIVSNNSIVSKGECYILSIPNYIDMVTVCVDDSAGKTSYAWMSTNTLSGSTPSYYSGCTLQTITEDTNTVKPSGAVYLYIHGKSSTNENRKPKKIILHSSLLSIDDIRKFSENSYYKRNIWDFIGYESGSIISSSNGSVNKSASYSAYVVTDYIPVRVGDVLYGYGERLAIYDADKSYVEMSSDKLNEGHEMQNGMHYIEVTTSSAAYVRMNYNTADANSKKELFLADTFAVEALKEKTANSSITYYAIGDSITRGKYAEIGASESIGPTEYGYPYWVAKANGFNLKNLGVSSSGYADLGRNDTSASFVNGKDVVDAESFTDADIVSIAYGINDYKSTASSPVVRLGSLSSTSGDGTVIGNMKYMIETIASKAPKAQIIVLLPMNQNRHGNGTEETNWSFGYAFRESKTLADYRAAIRECAEYYNLKVVDLEEVTPINRLNIRSCLGDGLHPTLGFHKAMGLALAPYIH